MRLEFQFIIVVRWENRKVNTSQKSFKQHEIKDLKDKYADLQYITGQKMNEKI